MDKEKFGILKDKIYAVAASVDEKISCQFGFRTREVSLDKIVDYLYTPKDPSSLAVVRILFGIAMLFDISGERGGSIMVERWGNPDICHLALVPFIRALPMPYMALVYAALWLGAVGIALGYKYRLSAVTFTLCYWYLFLVEKSFWNNHSYLFGLVATLLSFTDAHCCWSIDAVKNPSMKKEAVPYWNYFILKYQFFILYFMAGLKKGTVEWLTGYSVQNLSEHWVFTPFMLFLTVPQTDYLVVHWFVFVFDLTVAFWMMWRRTRHLAMFFGALFHLMNSRLFSIGMFPWVCLATMPLFYPFDWPKILVNTLKDLYFSMKTKACKCFHYILKTKVQVPDKNEEEIERTESNDNQIVEKDLQPPTQNTIDDGVKEVIKDVLNEVTQIDEDKERTSSISTKEDADIMKDSGNKDNVQEQYKGKNQGCKRITVLLIFLHIVTQAFLPFSHFITQGYNNWTEGLYGYSWDMMIHSWDFNSAVVKVVDNEQNIEFYINPNMYAPNDRWTRHGDMLYQYAHCIKDNLISKNRGIISNNFSIYVDVWYAMNGRFTQRMFDPKQDLLNASWSPFKPTSYLIPLLDEALSWRSALQEVRQAIYSSHNGSDVVFFADLPGYDHEKYVPTDLSNVMLTILEGNVLYEPEVSYTQDGHCYPLKTGDRMKLKNGRLHRVLNVGETPAYYMYTYVNQSDVLNLSKPTTTKLPIFQEFSRQLNNMLIFLNLVVKNTMSIVQELYRQLYNMLMFLNFIVTKIMETRGPLNICRSC